MLCTTIYMLNNNRFINECFMQRLMVFLRFRNHSFFYTPKWKAALILILECYAISLLMEVYIINNAIVQ
jgi:hypothetical protein